MGPPLVVLSQIPVIDWIGGKVGSKQISLDNSDLIIETVVGGYLDRIRHNRDEVRAWEGVGVGWRQRVSNIQLYPYLLFHLFIN